MSRPPSTRKASDASEVIEEALRWYIDDRNECAKQEENLGASDEIVREHEEEAEKAGNVLNSLQESSGLKVIDQPAEHVPTNQASLLGAASKGLNLLGVETVDDMMTIGVQLQDEYVILTVQTVE